MSESFLQSWHSAATTSLGLFWTAFWALGLGYAISSMIQVFVTRERMRRSMGETGPKSVFLGTFFGFISSSCSFAALSTARALFTKGAGLVPSLAFLLASTNLVIELGIIIALFLAWQFVAAEYIGGLLLILFTWLIVRSTGSERLMENAREHARDQEGHDHGETGSSMDWKAKIAGREGWRSVSEQYLMEWGMVWKDITIGFTAAGAIAAFLPQSFFETLFVGAGSSSPAFHEVLLQVLVGPLAAFFTFIGSMGNIPLAAVLFSKGVCFGGIMAFIFSDLVVFPVLRIQSKYYGWKMALYIVAVFLAALAAAALALHYGFAFAGLLPDPSSARSVTDRDYFSLDYAFALNAVFLVATVGAVAWRFQTQGLTLTPSRQVGERILLGLAIAAFCWLGAGLAAPLIA